MAQGRVPGLKGVSSPAHRPRGSSRTARLCSEALLALAIVAWLVTADRMGGMESMPGMALGGLGLLCHCLGGDDGGDDGPVGGSDGPDVRPPARGQPDRGSGAPRDATALFVCGYLLVWTAAGLVAYALYELVRSLDPSFLAWDEAGRYVTAGVILAAAAYQLTPAKQTCLASVPQPDDGPRRALAGRPAGRASSWASATGPGVSVAAGR